MNVLLSVFDAMKVLTLPFFLGAEPHPSHLILLQMSSQKKCQELVAIALATSPLIKVGMFHDHFRFINVFFKVLTLALELNGCPINPRRHVVCEPCSDQVNGGIDALHNQIVICSNRCQTEEKVEKILAHELIHLFDTCIGHLNYK